MHTYCAHVDCCVIGKKESQQTSIFVFDHPGPSQRRAQVHVLNLTVEFLFIHRPPRHSEEPMDQRRSGSGLHSEPDQDLSRPS